MINKFKPVNNQIDVVPLVHACPLFTHDVHACCSRMSFYDFLINFVRNKFAGFIDG